MLRSRNVVGYPIPRNRLTVYNRPYRRTQSLGERCIFTR